MHPRGFREALDATWVPSHRRVSYAVHMTTKGTPGRVIRVDDETWAAYEEVCDAKGLSRAADLRVYIKSQIAAHKRRVRSEQADANAASNVADS